MFLIIIDHLARYDLITSTIFYETLRVSNNSEAKASELLENFEQLFPRYS